VVLARGWDSPQKTKAWQKYVGLEVELMEPHGLDHAILMDASVPQIDGFRFFQALPWSPTRLLIEDNYYSHHPGLKIERIEQEVLHYMARRKWSVRQVLAHSHGALPLILELPKNQDPERLNPEIPRIGAESGFFHPVAGLTVPTLLRQITAITEKSNLTMPSILRTLREVEDEAKVRLRYDRLMNRLLFRASEPTQRYRVLSHFYRMPEPLIERFYAGKTHVFDQMRLMAGRPPVPWSKALRVLREGSA
jgi:lycopene beta-cyclase